MTRIESASSINTYNSCARKYFYHYKLNLPSKDSIATLNGKAVHTALEHFFNINSEILTFPDYENELKNHLLTSFNQAWIQAVPSLMNLAENKDTIKTYYQDSLQMLDHFVSIFTSKLKLEIQTKSLKEAFNALKPQTEVALLSSTRHVRGFIDAVHTTNQEVFILDYKTSRSDEITEEYKLQLAIYALLYKEQFGKTPSKVGLSFLRHGSEKFVPVDQELLAHAEEECFTIHEKTTSNNIEEYPKNLGTGCRWCDYKDYCFGQKSLVDYQPAKEETQ